MYISLCLSIYLVSISIKGKKRISNSERRFRKKQRKLAAEEAAKEAKETIP